MVHYSDGVAIMSSLDAEWRSQAGKCMDKACYEATFAYLNAYTDQEYAYMQFVGDSLDASDYGPRKAQEIMAANVVKSLDDYYAESNIADQLLNAMRITCKSPFATPN